jgi:hypothetical protein
MTANIFAVRAAAYAQKFGTRCFAALPQEEVDRFHASLEVFSVERVECELDEVFLPLATSIALHYNFAWRATNAIPLSLVLSAPLAASPGDPPLFLGEEFFTFAARELELNGIAPERGHLRLAGLVKTTQLALVYVFRLNHHFTPPPDSLSLEFGQAEMKEQRDKFDFTSQILIDHCEAL